jgi:hypothetical protein
MNKFTNTITLLSLLVLAIGSSGCLVEETELEVVLNEETCATFHQDEGDENFTTPYTLFIGEDLDSILADNDVSRSDIEDANLVSANYTVTEFSHDHDWTISGAITVQREDITDGPDTILTYSSQDISAGVVDVVNPADLHPNGVALIERALDDFIAGTNPTLTFTVVSGDVEIDPTPGDRLVFSWDACLFIQVIYSMTSDKYEPF